MTDEAHHPEGSGSDLRDLGVDDGSAARDSSRHHRSPGDDPGLRNTTLLLLILVLAAALRLYGIGGESLWFDEAATVRIVRQGWGEMFASIKDAERIPPLHYVLLWVWVRVFGHAEWSVRLPSALAGIGSVWALFLLGKRLFRTGAGLIAALFLAVAPYQISYAQEARAYTLMVLLSLLSCWLFVRVLDADEPKARFDAAYVLAAAAALYSHLYAVFALLAQALTYAVAWTRADKPLLGVRRWVVTQIGIAALFLAWLPVAIRWARSVGSGFWLPPATAGDVWSAYVTYAGGSVPLLVLLLILGMVGVVAQRRNPRGLTLMLALATLPVVVPVIASILTKPTFTPRYGLVAPAALYALVACGVIAVRNRFAQGAAVLAMAALSLNGIRTIPPKSDWRGTVAHVERSAAPGDYVAMTPRLSTYPYDYYATRTDVRRKGFDSGAIPLTLPLDPGVRVWFIYEPWAFNPRDVLARGSWRTRSSREFEGLMVLELDDGDDAAAPAPSTDPPTAGPTTTGPTTTAPSAASRPRSSTHSG